MTMRITRIAAVLGIFALTGCATKGALRKGLDEQRAALEAERTERVAADERLAADLAQLRTDLQALRTEFGAKIEAAENGLSFTLPVHFPYDVATVQAGDVAALDRFAEVVNKHFGGAVVTVEGFADPAGTRAYNVQLSSRRADAVKAHLLTRNIAADVRTVGYGETRLVVPNAEKNEAGAELNRRVVFVIESPAAARQVTAALMN
ncbi:MAG TPA: OmpA family protein [Longimicrobiales bacterium]|nr:OmpA family protein [Longimicrobiales bacterium]